MNISFQKLLMKMEDELRLAKTADTEAAKRERIHSIKTLCELVLDEPVQQGAGSAGYSSPVTRSIAQPAPPQYVPAQPVLAAQPQPQMPVTQSSPMVPQPKKLETDDDSNGDSLFDF